jgi:hypothetical protein
VGDRNKGKRNKEGNRQGESINITKEEEIERNERREIQNKYKHLLVIPTV